MYLGCSSESYSQALGAGRLTLDGFIRICGEELGLPAVELEDGHIGEPTPARLAELRAAAERHRLEIVDIALMNNFGVADDEKRRGEEARTARWMPASREIGSRFLRTFAGWPEGERFARWPAMLAAMRSVVTAAEAAQVQLVMENHNHGGFVQTADDVLAIFDAVSSPALALLLDTGNYVDGLASIRRTAGSRGTSTRSSAALVPTAATGWSTTRPWSRSSGRWGTRGVSPSNTRARSRRRARFRAPSLTCGASWRVEAVPVIQGYPRQPSVRPGDTLTLHVSTDYPHFRVEVYRQGARLEPMGRLGPERLPGHPVPAGPPDRDWGWPAYALPIPAGWPSGVYIAMLIEIDAEGRAHAPDVTTRRRHRGQGALRRAEPRAGRVDHHPVQARLGHLSRLQRHGLRESLHGGGLDGRRGAPGFTVTTRRPGGGTGGVVMYGDSPDYYDPTSRRQTFTHWEAPFVPGSRRTATASTTRPTGTSRWIPELLTPYALMLSVGHDEYWSDEMRARIEAFIRRGGNVAFFSGNICGYRIHFGDGNSAFTCAKVRPSGKDRGDLGGRPLVGRAPGERRDRDEHPPGRRLVGRPPGHRRLHGAALGPLGLRGHRAQGRGRVRGRPRVPAGRLRGGRRYLHPEARPGRRHRRPGDAAQLLHPGDRGAGRRLGPRRSPHAAATMGLVHERPRGIVFNGATTDWPCLVGRNAEVDADHAERARSVSASGRSPSSGPCRCGMAACSRRRASRRTSTWTLAETAAGSDRRSPLRLARSPRTRGTAARRPAGGRRGPHARRADAAPSPSPVTVTVTVMERGPARRLRYADVRAPVGGGGPQDRRSRAAARDGDARASRRTRWCTRPPSRRAGRGCCTRRGACVSRGWRTGLPAWRRWCAGSVPGGASVPTGRMGFDERFTLDTSGRA